MSDSPPQRPALPLKLGRMRARLDKLHSALAAVAENRGDATAALAEAAAARDRDAWDFRAQLEPLVDAADVDQQDAYRIERLLLEIEEARDEWPPDGAAVERRRAAAAAAQAHIAAARTEMHNLLLPGDVAAALADVPFGGSVTLTSVSPDGLDERQALAVLAAHPREFPGVVDAAAGVIYRTADTTPKKLLWCAAPVGALLVGVIVLWIVGHLDEWVGLSIDQLKSTRRLLEVYALVTIGSLAHLVVAVRKASKATANGVGQVPSAFLDWAHLRAWSLCWLLIPILTTTLFLRFANLRIEGVEEWAVAILAGYSADSVAQLAFDRLNTAVELFAAKTRGLGA